MTLTMNGDKNARLHEILSQAVAMQPSQRATFLAEACAGDESLRSRVEAMLANDPGEPMPLRIAGFAIRAKIGEGGMGVVYLAQRERHPHDTRALKVIRPGMDSKEVLARFEAEQKALTQLDHPCIVKFAEPGLTEDRRPCFTMEYVRGTPITHFCDENGLDLAARLALFADVCEAVEHAHTRGIVHRDLKPANVLVCMLDGKPVPKIIDWGVAKALHYELSERTLFTEQGRWVGTPEYMAPETFGKTASDADARADVYSLGVLLYELLVGVPPIEGKTLRGKAWDEMARLLREFQPDRPSTRKRTVGASADPNAPTRGIDIHAVPRLHRDEIDEITLKALEKKPADRFQSAGEFARCIQRQLRGDRLFATPVGPWWARLRRNVRRHRTGYVSAVVGAVALAVVSSVAASRIERSRCDSLLDEAEGLLAKEDYAAAIRRAETAAQVCTGYRRAVDAVEKYRGSLCDALLDEAKAILNNKQGEYGASIRRADQAADLCPRYGRALIAQAYYRQKRIKAAPLTDPQRATDVGDALRIVESYFQHGIQDDKEWWFWIIRADLLLSVDRPVHDDVEAAISEAIKLAPAQQQPNLRIPRVANLALQHRFEEALQAALDATRLQAALPASEDPNRRDMDTDEIWRHLGAIYLYFGRLEEAQAALDKAIVISKDDHRNGAMLARCRLRLGDYFAASAPAEAKPEYSISYYDRILALTRLRMKQYDLAISAARDQRFGPDPIPEFRHLIVAIAEARAGNLAKAREALQTAESVRSAQLDEAGEVFVTFGNDLLWIDDQSELADLREEADSLIDEPDEPSKTSGDVERK